MSQTLISLIVYAGALSQVSELAADFSFAYLKELVLSSMMDWIASPGQRTMNEVMEAKVASLREQMVSLSSVDADWPGDMHMGPMGRVMGTPRR